MTDRELLEAAAKAAEIQLLWTYGGQPVNVPTLFKGMGSDEVWNPLTDSGQALELAAKLGDRGGRVIFLIDTKHDGDPLAATRRAIVRAAAEIGRSMK